MRRAAGIILIILSMVSLVGMIMSVIGWDYWPRIWWAVSRWIVYGGLLLAGGVFCLRRRYWGLCLVSALLTILVTILPAVEDLVRGSFVYLMEWRVWILVVGALVSTIFISVTKKEWKEFSGSLDSKVSYGG